MADITAVEMNYMIWRYLHETGLLHSAFNLFNEAGVNKSLDGAELVAPSTLVTLTQKGLQYLEMEANMTLDDMDDEFIFFPTMELITKDVSELQKIAADRKKSKLLAEATNVDKKNEEKQAVGTPQVKGETKKGQEKQAKEIGGKPPLPWGRKRSRRYLR